MASPALHITILTLFPDMFPGPLGLSIAGKALQDGIWDIDIVNIRDFAKDQYQTVDDKAFGGGTGLVMKPDVLGDAIEHVKKDRPKAKWLYMSPRGVPLTQEKTREYSTIQELAIICGRYEGIDERILEHYDIEEVSIGDYILSGGEIPALALIDACIRQLPSVLSSPDALSKESFGCGAFAKLLEYPHYTRPAEWNGHHVPEVLLSGNHQEIEEWRLKQSEALTEQRRKDLWSQYNPSASKK